MPDLLCEFRHVLRSLRRAKAYTAASLLTLTIALTLLIVTGTVVDRVLIRDLPYYAPQQLRLVYEARANGDLRLASYPAFLDAQAQSRAVASLGYVRATGHNVQTSSGLIRATAANVTPGYFHVLGARPGLGRLFTAEEEAAGHGDAVVLSYAFWQRTFGGDSSIVGRPVTLDGSSVRVVGVLPRGVGYPSWASLWRPIGGILNTDATLVSRHLHSDGRVIARLRPGIDSIHAATVLSTVAARLAHAYTEDALWTSMVLPPLANEVLGDVSASLWVLAGAAGLIWLLMCVNVANLAVARSIARTREVAIHAALGATRLRLARRTILEGLTVAMAAGMLASLLSTWIVRRLATATVPGLPRTEELGMDVRVVVAAVAASVVTGLVASVLPALLPRSLRVVDALRHGRTASAGGRRGSRARHVLIGAQVGLALLLLIAAGLLAETLLRLSQRDLGFAPDQVSTFYVFPPAPKYNQSHQAAALYQRLIDAVAAIPGVESAAVVNTPPLTGGSVVTAVTLPTAAPSAEPGNALYITVSDEYLATMGLRLRQGRWFTAADMRARDDGVVINAAMARRYWPDQNPVGRALTIFRSSQARRGYGTPMPSTVIGMVDDVRHFGHTARAPAQVYVPYTREVWPGIALVVRTTARPELAIPTLRRTVRDMLPDIPLDDASGTFGFRPLTGFAAEAVAAQRYLAWLVTAFAVAALLLAVIGIYGLTTYTVGQRLPEFGIRLALGARKGHLATTVLSDAVQPALLGACVGIVAALALTRVIQSVLYGTPPTDPGTFLTATLLVLLAATAAALVPAYRASRVDPVIAIRSE